MFSVYQDAKKIWDFAPRLQGVFGKADLKSLLNPSDTVQFYRRIKKLEDEGVLQRFSRGFYLAQEGNLEALSQRLCTESYISFGNVLAQQLFIGSIPKFQVMAVKLGKKRVYESEQEKIIHFGITPSLFFGWRADVNGIKYADPEKAFLDTLYFYQHGVKFFFDPFSDVQFDRFDQEKVRVYLQRYQNSKFISFTEEVLGL
jgi:predicted transcriptional regulator of viral defense system